MNMPIEISQAVDATLRRYDLADPDEEIAIAFSGGKDSIGLCLCLQQLGHPFQAIAVDMGYESAWARRIAALAAALGINVSIVSVRGPQFPGMRDADHLQIRRRLKILSSITSSGSSSVTPCTHCYNTKVIALDNAVRDRGLAKIAFGHHLTDACASLLKEAILRIDCIDLGHELYTRNNFESLVQELALEGADYPRTGGGLTRRITELVQDRRIDTDEPPRQRLRIDNDGVDIIRPLFGTWENMLIRLSAELKVTPEGSGCGHGATANTETPREMVQYRVLRNSSAQFSAHIAALVLGGISQDGRTSIKARYRRTEDLGAGYKPTPVSGKL
jgi:predicted subunit of tRNA(5-methylaminomethyl-2-thiouridylate) methyltransferase